MARVLLVEREVAGDEGEDPAGLQSVDGLREEEVMEREPLAAVGELHIGKRRVADNRVDGLSGSLVSAKLSMRMSCSG